MRISNPFLRLYSAGVVAAIALISSDAGAREFYIGGPVHVNDMEIVANYLVGIEMAPMAPGTAHGADVIHLEADVHATADNVYGYPDGAWVPNLPIAFSMEKQGSDWRASGTLKAMQAKDGPHYADNVKMDGPGEYRVTLRFDTPDKTGFLRHVDKETGVPEWWKPFSQDFTFKYPAGK